MKTRTLTPSEDRGLTDNQKAYLQTHPSSVCLQPHELAKEALYKTLRHGVVTIDRAMELDGIHDQLVKTAKTPREQILDNYSNEEDSFIDRHGMSSRLC